MALPFSDDLVIEQRAEFIRSWIWNVSGVAQSLATYNPRSHFRSSSGSPLILDLTQYITLEPAGVVGRIQLIIPATVTATLTHGGRWDFFLIDKSTADVAVKLISGSVRVERAVTHD